MESISGKDLVSIIKACKGAGVAYLKIDNIEIEFQGADLDRENPAEQFYEISIPEVSKMVNPRTNQAVTTASDDKEEVIDDLDDILLPVENPVEWEKQALKKS